MPGPKFLYPTSRRYLVDEVCEQIVREYEKRNWKVPGIKVAFHDHGQYRSVSTLRSLDFRLCFGRWQGMLDQTWNDTAAICEITIPGHEIIFYDDHSGPTYFHYIGGNWESQREMFFDRLKINPKQRNEPRIYLRYSGSNTGGQILVHDTDFGCQYDLEKGDAKSYRTDDILTIFRDWLIENVLGAILDVPEEG